jgi:hypothetical protein
MNAFGRWIASVLVWGALGSAAACRKADESAMGSRERAPSASAASSAQANVAELAPSDSGTWITSDIYDFKLDGAKYCAKPKEKSDAGAAVWVGAKVQVLAKTDELFVDRRHASLRDKGIYFQASLDPDPLEGCVPAFKPSHLKKGQVASGYIAFELPTAWKDLVLEFQPTRWGGAGRVRASVPDLGTPP